MRAELIKGAIAGLAATWAMDRVTRAMYRCDSPAARRRYNRVTGGKSVALRCAEEVDEALGLELEEEPRKSLAQATHSIVGMAAGAGYALARARFPRVHAGHGLAFGILFWLVFDETMTVVAGLARPPQDYPWQAHARGLVGHVTYGMVADGTLHALDATTL